MFLCFTTRWQQRKLQMSNGTGEMLLSCVCVHLWAPPQQLLQLSVVKSCSEGEHLWQLEVRGHQTADCVPGVVETQRCVHTLHRCLYCAHTHKHADYRMIR